MSEYQRPNPIEIETPRLRLRGWTDTDREPFAAMGADPEVMEFFPALLTCEESDAFIDRCLARFEAHGWGLWAIEVKGSGRNGQQNRAASFIGFTGLAIPGWTFPFSPCVEIGWRLARSHWGKGYATEAAQAALRFGFETLDLEAIVSFTTVANRRSRAVMERLGMRDTLQDFDHPGLPDGHRWQRHCLYRLTKSRWEEGGR
ncbi:MAG: GNAT family N-acetyltransferase [Planctomycetes bacterium]|nr:GNAT family N-acetyltransferase [Planctomycetota bacterium]